MRLIEGNVEDPQETRIADLEQENEDLRQQVSALKFQVGDAQRQSAQSLTNLRKQLSPLYRALQNVFGELDKAGVADVAMDGGVLPPRVSAVWESWKQRLGSTSKLIDALLLHGEMNTQQLSVTTGFHRTTIPAHIFKLNKNGLLNKNGGKFSLKQL